ncbi:transcriptional regulator, LysR family [Sorangium cellulosum So ce56]|uniref:Transcriptional regulator, LysR family n=1 Tax=Sorangium cellulosum (strain So ce56) TaxID=448385 RepID=A9GJI0_SORC5|nr:LysR family transcriptional regulator [Sorangium cellulosum]CAN93410.1 transcriptional regulator, LysR family [Sorangium cellulosum So ce56]
MVSLAAIELLVATVEAGSFSRAARRLGVTPSAVSRRVMRLEQELGVALLARTTRSLRLTDDGQAFYARCVRIVEELGEATEAIARASKKPVGLLRVDAPVALGRDVIAPSLPRFAARYPDVRINLTLRDQHVDPVAEGLDLLVRIGPLGDSSLVARRLGASRLVHCAAPSYIARRGAPATPADLAGHDCVGYLRDGRPTGFRFLTGDGDAVLEVPISGPFHANDVDVLRHLAIAGSGIIAMFDFLAKDALAEGTLVTVLDEFPTTTWPIHALYPKNRHLLPKVRVFVDFLAEIFAPPSPERRGERRRSGRR